MIQNKSKGHGYTIYTGCLIPSKFPFIEMASRKVMDKLGISLYQLDGATCCPNQMAIKSSDKLLWQTIAGRNLALAEEMDHDIVSLCNGCYNTLKTVNSALKSDEKLRDQVNGDLSKIGITFNGTIEVKHIIEVLINDIGPNAIERALTRQLKGLKAGTFFGCHVVRPEDHMGFDDPEKPKTLDELVELIGIQSVPYTEKHSCCGGGLKIARKEDAIDFARKTLLSMKEKGANCVVVTCPYCMVQLEYSQEEINSVYGDKLNLPVFYYTELLGLAMGFTPKELGLDIHNKYGVKNQDLLDSVLGTQNLDVNGLFDDKVTREQLEICSKCLACADDCQAAMTTNYHPEELVALALEGKIDELIHRKDIWYCMNCHDCIDHCPQDFGIVNLIFKLKNLAILHGIFPDVISHRGTELMASGYAFTPDQKTREKLGLPQIIGADSGQIEKILKNSNVQKVIEGNVKKNEKKINKADMKEAAK